MWDTPSEAAESEPASEMKPNRITMWRALMGRIPSR